MTQIRKILQGLHNGWSIRKVAKRTAIARNTIRTYQRRIRDQDLDIEQLLKLEDEQLSQLVFAPITDECSRHADLLGRMSYIEDELGKVGVTRKRLWEEYREEREDGYGYSQFCDHLYQWRKSRELVMHLNHESGEILEADFTGKKLSYVDESTGEVIDCDSLITVLPYSNMIFIEVVPNQQQEHLSSGLGHALGYYEGVAQAIKVDNLRSAVTRSDRYEPTFTELMDEFAQHYGTTAITARVGKPRDKSTVENSVKIVYQEIYAELRHRVFFSIAEMNAVVKPLPDKLNKKNFKDKDYSRRDLFEQSEKSVLQPLPSSRFIVRKTARYKVQKNYHILLGQDMHY